MIFVHIASYRDPECEPTVRDMLAKARHPETLRICIVLQQMEDDNFSFDAHNTEFHIVKAEETRGCCWARNLGYSFYNGEEYVLQLDSHMRFVQNWDMLLYEQLARAYRANPDINKVLLTTYPPGYQPPNTIPDPNPCFLRAKSFGHDGRLSQGGAIYHLKSDDAPIMTALMSGNFLFAPGRWVKEVPYDPYLYFAGEEPTLAARSWTHGWDMFCPSQTIVFHKYGREGRRLHWDDDLLWHRKDAVSLLRYRHLLNIESTTDQPALQELSSYGMGTIRTFEAYQQFSGINYKHQTLSTDAQNGKWHL